MTLDSIEQFNQFLKPMNVQVKLVSGAGQDFKSFNKNQRITILALVLKQIEKNPLLRPDGNGIPLHGPLRGFAKIKSKSTSLRIVYKPVVIGNIIELQVIAIGPRDHDDVYRKAIHRLLNRQ